MLESNVHGFKCEKCREWVNPFVGISFFKLTFHAHCFEPYFDKFQNFLKSLLKD